MTVALIKIKIPNLPTIFIQILIAAAPVKQSLAGSNQKQKPW